VGYQVHTSGDGPTCPWGSARADFYNVTGIPDVWVDGVLEQLGDFGSDQANYDNMLGLISQRLAEPTDLSIEMYGEPSGDQTYAITGVLSLDADGEARTFKLHLVDALANYPDSADGQYNNGVIQGYDLGEFSLQPGQSATIVHQLTFTDVSWSNQEDIRLAMIAQEPLGSGPAEIYNAEMMGWPFPKLLLCPADINGDEYVNVDDLFMVINAWGPCADCPEDINGDGFVNVDDLFEVMNGWGPCPSEPLGACCNWDGTCADMTWYDCMVQGNSEWFEGEECGSFDCPTLPTGACCLGTDCIGTYTEYECFVAGGIWYEGKDCDSYVCEWVYCDSASTNCDFEHISRVVCGTIDHTSDCGYYQDFTDVMTDMYLDVPSEITVENPEYWDTDIVTVWVDWNQNGQFTDSGEMFEFGDQGGNITVGIIMPPADAALGQTRMRVTLQYGGVPDPCAFFTYGEVEDYTVEVKPSLGR
jgi:hypothetical protein